MTNRTCKIIDGRAYTDGDTALITDLPFEEQQFNSQKLTQFMLYQLWFKTYLGKGFEYIFN